MRRTPLWPATTPAQNAGTPTPERRDRAETRDRDASHAGSFRSARPVGALATSCLTPVDHLAHGSSSSARLRRERRILNVSSIVNSRSAASSESSPSCSNVLAAVTVAGIQLLLLGDDCDDLTLECRLTQTPRMCNV